MKNNIKILIIILLFCAFQEAHLYAQTNFERFADKEAAAAAGYSMQRRECAEGEIEVKGAFGQPPHDMLVFKYVKEQPAVVDNPPTTTTDTPVVEERPTAVTPSEPIENQAMEEDTHTRNFPIPDVQADVQPQTFDIAKWGIYILVGVLFILLLLLLFWVFRLYTMYRDKLTELENMIYQIQKNPMKVDVAPQVKSELERQMMSRDFERAVSSVVHHTIETSLMGHSLSTTPQQEIVIDQLVEGGSALPVIEKRPTPSPTPIATPAPTIDIVYDEPQIQPMYRPVAPNEQ